MPGIEERPLARGGARYVVRVRDTERGKSTSATFATRPEAERFVRDCDDRGVPWALTEHRRAKDVAAEPTLDEWAVRYLAALTDVTEGTRTTYRRVYDRTWSQPLGGLHLSQLTREQIARALLEVKGSDKTVRNAWGVLASMLKVAVEDDLLPRSPAKGIKLARRTSHETTEHRYVTHDEFWQIYEQTPRHWQPFVMTAFTTGMRWGELAALEVGDISLETAVARVTKAEKWDPSTSTRTVGPPKTAKSRRTITLPSETLEELRPLCESRGRRERLFLPPKGGPLRHMTFYRDIWIKKCTVNLDPRPRFHDARHSHVAWLIAAGVPLPVIQSRLGHEKITTTIDTYGHLLPDLQRAAGDAAGMVLRPSRPLQIE